MSDPNVLVRERLRTAVHPAAFEPDLDDVRHRVQRRHRAQRIREAAFVGVAVVALVSVLISVILPLISIRNGRHPLATAVAKDTIPEGAMLLFTRFGTEIWRSGDRSSRILAGDVVPYALSPDGSTVAGTTEVREGIQSRRTEIVLVDVRSGSKTILAEAGASQSFGPLEWSDDGSLLAYRLDHSDIASSDVCTISPATRDRRCYVDPLSVDDFDWSPDGAALLIRNGDGGIDEIDVGTGAVSAVVAPSSSSFLLTRAGFERVSGFTSPRWSASGRYFAARVDGTPGGTGVAVFDASGDVVMAGPAGNADFFGFAWSPVSDTLSFTTGSEPITSPDATWSLHVVDMAGGGETISLSSQHTLPRGIVWSPSGRWIGLGVFTGSHHESQQLLMVDTEGPPSTTELDLGNVGVGDSLRGWGPAVSLAACEVDAVCHAKWAREVVEEAGYRVDHDTGSALLIDVGDDGAYVWATEAVGAGELHREGYEPLPPVEGVALYSDGTRVTWSVQGLSVWVGRYLGPLPPEEELAPLVRASIDVGYPAR